MAYERTPLTVKSASEATTLRKVAESNRSLLANSQALGMYTIYTPESICFTYTLKLCYRA